jgi:hypothetical protein
MSLPHFGRSLLKVFILNLFKLVIIVTLASQWSGYAAFCCYRRRKGSLPAICNSSCQVAVRAKPMSLQIDTDFLPEPARFLALLATAEAWTDLEQHGCALPQCSCPSSIHREQQPQQAAGVNHWH